MPATVHIVTCFITRPGKNGTELLLFNYPDVGVQIPSGTVNPGEEVEAAARREAAEESSLDNLVLRRFLGQADDPPPPGYEVVASPTSDYSRPNRSSMDWAHFRSGIPVEVLRVEGDFTQVRYEETDRFENPRYVSYNITGWVSNEALTSQRLRHFYLFEASNPTPAVWSVSIDYGIFQLFWAPLDHLSSIVSPQVGWVRGLDEAI